MDEDTKHSRFNAGVALAERIDMMQKAINMARFNPLAVNPETQTYNYQIMLEANNSLLAEAWAKLTEKEQVEADKIFKLANGFEKIFPIVNNNSNGTVTINRQNFEKFKYILTHYERKNKIYLDEHSLNAPNMDDDDEGL